VNWDALGAIAELVGATAVVASLAYVGVQIRHNTRASQAATTSDAASTIRDWLGSVVADPELSRIFGTGIEGMARLESEDQRRFVFMIFNFLKATEDLHFQAERGLMDPELWNGWHYMIGGYLTTPGIQEYWRMRRQGFSPAFQRYVDGLQPDDSFMKESGLTAVLSGDGATAAT
jgi:hypothetical protein